MISQSCEMKSNVSFQQLPHVGCSYIYNFHQWKKSSNFIKGIISDMPLAYLTHKCGCSEGRKSKEGSFYFEINSD